ncbi:MAG TPA: hypothetical protein VN426_03210 [Syntrophomonadaceae bacterium]|nr:hypothetical protein [Syntrophomonadaceae bacterium]
MFSTKVVTSTILVFALLALPGCSHKQVAPSTKTEAPASSSKVVQAVTQIVKLTDIAEKSEAEVAKILGPPLTELKDQDKWRYYGSNEWIANCPTFHYINGISIKYVEGKAAQITITPVDPLAYADFNKALQLVGLIPVTPSAKTDAGATWNNIEGIYKFQVFNYKGKVSYIYAIVNEKYR